MSLHHFAFRILGISILLLATLRGNAQIAPSEYYGVQERLKQMVFIDEFEDNRNNWPLGSYYLNETMVGGEYKCESRAAHTYSKTQQVALEENTDFEAEVRLRLARGREATDFLGLTFGRDEQGNEFSFVINPDMTFQVYEYQQGRRYTLINWTSAPSLRLKHGYQRLTIRASDDTWYFFINKEYVAEMPARPLFGNHFGFTLGGNIALEVDYLRISQMAPPDEEGPLLTLFEPGIAPGSHKVFYDPRQMVRGRVEDASGIASVTINNRKIMISPEGEFTASLILPEGQTPIQVMAMDDLGNATTYDYVLEYIEAVAPAVSQVPEPMNEEEVTAALQSSNQNYLLLIGINDYNYWNPLHNAVKDCKDLAETLTHYYQFDPDHIISLFNENATRENILETFEGLQEIIGEHDNLLIYYAGHGFYDESSALGYWVPSDARLNKIPDFIRNSTIHDYLRTINSKHTLLIADACYAGSLFTTYRGQLNEQSRSRWAFTSGDIEKVWDGQPGQNSPFARYLIRFLLENTQAKVAANEMIDAVGAMVERNTAQTPQGNPLRQAGDDGGVFVFYRR